MKYEYDTLKHSARVWLHEYRATHIHAFLCHAINDTKLALRIRGFV